MHPKWIFTSFWLKSNPKEIINQINLQNLNVENDWRAPNEPKQMIKSLSRIFFTHVFLVRIQAKKCHGNDSTSITFHGLHSFGVPLHTENEWYCSLGSLAVVMFLCSLSTPNNRFILEWAVAASNSMLRFSNEKKSIESTLVHYYRIATRCAPIWKQRILCRFRFCSSFDCLFQEIRSSTLLQRSDTENQAKQQYLVHHSLCLSACACILNWTLHEINFVTQRWKKRTKLLRNSPLFHSLYCNDFF